MSFNLKLQYLMAGCFVLLAPLSVAPELSFAEAAKYLRLLTTVVIVGAGMITAHRLRMGPGSRMLTAFVLVFSLSGAWSDAPLWGLFNKGMFGLTCLSGIIMACSLRSPAEMRSAFRFLGLVAGGAAVVTLLIFLKNPHATTTMNRMAVFGINPNMMGHAAVPLSILCMHSAIEERSRVWRILMIGACCILALVIIATGCRGAALTMMIGTACLVAPHSRRPGVLLGVILISALVAFVGFEILDIGGNDRMIAEMGKNNRAAVWKSGIKAFQKAPLLGRGWLHMGSRSVTVLNIYIQTLAETGIIGAALLAVTLASIAGGWFSSFSRVKRLRLPSGTAYLALSLILVELVHGITESGPFVGTGVAPLALGLGVGLADRAAELAVSGQAYPQYNPEGRSQVRRRPSAREVLDALRQKPGQLPVPPA